jgi:nitrate reductase alpha subunit
MLAQYGVGRPGLPGDWPTGYDDVASPYTPAWQAEITGVPAQQCIRIAREFATNSEQSQGRSMIIMGAGICQWFHGDTTYRSILALLILTGCMGRNGGGWAHYVGQEKCRPITGWNAGCSTIPRSSASNCADIGRLRPPTGKSQARAMRCFSARKPG